jgi:uncharacterized protein
MGKTDRVGRTDLHYAAADRDFERARELLLSGADAAARDNMGWTALHFAAQENALDVADLLIRNGADVDAQDTLGNTPLSNAVFNSRGWGEMIALLRKAGADPKIANRSGVTPLSLARTIANFDVAQFFADLP